MKDLFMCLLLNLAQHGKITEANLYRSGDFSNVTVKTDNGTYRVSISKEDEDNSPKTVSEI